jgi:uncharacterized protein YfaS (alpha-2-macroglobulin family)
MSDCCDPSDALGIAACAACTTAVVIPLAIPREVDPERGGLQLRMASTALTGLSDAARFLVDYPHGCVEQTASRLLPLLALGELGPELTGLEASALEARVEAGLARMSSMQRPSGGFSYWPGFGAENEYASFWATLVLGEAVRAGRCPEQSACGRMRAIALEYTSRVLMAPLNLDLELLELASQRVDRVYAAYVLADAEQLRPEHAELIAALAPEWKELPLFARFWLLEVLRQCEQLGLELEGVDTAALSAELLQSALNQATETARSLHFRELQLPGRWMSSEFRTDAIALEVLLRRDPKDPLLPELVAGLQAARQGGRWRTTQENGWALRAMVRYLEAVEARPPRFVAAAWLGDTSLVEQRFEGRSGKPQESLVPMATLLEEPSDTLLVAKRGEGVLYYRLGLDYTPSDQRLPALDAGISLERRYELVSQALGSKEKTEQMQRLDAEGLATVPAGAVVRVTLSVESADRRYYVALEDPLPAGFEPIEAANKTTGASERAIYTQEWGGAFNYREYFDDRVVFYADVMGSGKRSVSYLVRATSPGSYWAAPPKIEEMYAPEVFGRDQGLQVEIQRSL